MASDFILSFAKAMADRSNFARLPSSSDFDATSWWTEVDLVFLIPVR
jgi:hypothetical protein